MNYHRDKVYIENESLFRNIFQSRFSLVIKHLGGARAHPRGVRVLDIGCSNGVFLDLFKERDWETWGVEPSGTANIANTRGHRVINKVFEKTKLPKKYFDLVIMNHTLEHMDNPLTVIKKVHSLLKKGGILFVDVPNAGGLSSMILGKHWPYRLPNEHKHQFTKQSLSKIFDKAGFRVIFFKSRSGIFEYANPFLELSRPRFIFDLIASPYSLLTTLFNMGDSMSLIGKKI